MNNSVYKKGLAVVLIIAIIIMAALGIKLSGGDEEIIFTNYSSIDANESDEINEGIKEEAKVYIYVDMDGAVVNPGVYGLIEGSRVIDAINMAGGLTEKAFTQNLNKARKLVDGEKIFINEEGEAADVFIDDKLININTASENSLMSLPGIGEVYAKRIIEYRNAKRFNSIEEIKNIQGIGDKTFDKLKDLITIN
ncbi:MAG TPA: DUF655 domain-containing protein [Sedimentibacter sp.]|nr:DUF655 domain-containing protein [Sedimentibacter sp.]HPW99926.1 DUF655 domain-containing protein [Sedimentibacter sp.]HQB62821.1 DUF655 domain-containing protein [Sedimentibacter sp.]